MKNVKSFNLVRILGILAFLISCVLKAQVGINTSTPFAGAALEIEGSNKGFIMTKVALTGTNDNTTITPSNTIGVMVYNTATAGAINVRVNPGFYYWSGTSWRRFNNQGYTIEYTQNNEARAPTFNNGVSNLVYVILPGLDTGTITVPFSGTYQIRVEAFYSAGDLISTSGDGGSQGSISLAMATGAGPLSMIKETYITTSSKRLGSTTVNNLAQSATILWNIDLTAGVNYRFAVRGREWLTNNVSNGYYGKNTSGYPGSGTLNTAQRGTMSVTLIKQF